MIGAVERDEALGMARRLIDGGGIVDADGRVLRRVKDQQRLSKRADSLALVVRGEIVDERPAQPERPPADPHFRLALGPQRIDVVGKQMGDMVDVERRGDRRHRPGLGEMRGRG